MVQTFLFLQHYRKCDLQSHTPTWVGLFSLTLWTRGGPKTNPQRLCLITKPQLIEYRKLYRSEEPEGDGRAGTTFDFRLY